MNKLMASNILKPMTLKNGMTVFRFPKTGSNAFVVGFAVRTGSAIESDHFPHGISHIVERMFWKGTDKHSTLKLLNQALEGMGGEFFSHTGRELTQFYIKVPSYHQFRAISMLAEIIQHSFFQEYDIEQEKKRILEELRSFDDAILPNTVELSLSNTYQSHGLGLPIHGSIESLTTISSKHIIEYLAHQYNPKNCYLVLSGNFDTKASIELLEQEWHLWNPRTFERVEKDPVTEDIIGTLPRLDFRQRGLSQTLLGLGFVLEGGLTPNLNATEDNRNSPNELDLLQEMLADWSKLLVLSTLLGQGLSSRLWAKCVEEEMLFSSITSQLILFEQTGFLHIGGTITDSSQFTFALESVLSTLEALKKTTISINEFTKTKEYLKGRIVLEHEDILTSTIWHVEMMLMSGMLLTKEDLIEHINQVDAHSIRSLAMDLFVPSRMTLTTLGTAKSSPVITKLIQKYLQT